MPIDRLTLRIRSPALTGRENACSVRSASSAANDSTPLGPADQDGELVAAQAGDDVVAAHGAHEPRGHALEQLVADGVPERVVDALEVVEVDEHHRDLVARAGLERLAHLLAEQRAVGQAGQRVVRGLVPELVLQLAQVGDGLLEAVVLERGAGVGGQGVEQRAVVLGEAAAQPEAVGQHERADHPVLAAQDGDHRVAHAALGEVAGQLRGERGLDPHGARGGLRHGAHGGRRGGVDRRHRLARAARAEPGAQRDGAVDAEQDDLGALGPEGLQRALEQALDGHRHLGRAGQRAVGLVEELDLLVALALGHVGAIAEEGDQDRDDQQRRGGRARHPQHGADQRHRRGRGGDQEVHAEHLADLAAGDAALGDDDRREDEPDRHQAAGLGGGQDGEPGDPAEVGVVRDAGVHDQHGDLRDEAELGDVERQLHRRQPPQRQRGARAERHADHRPGAAGEHERQRDRDVGQREGMRAAAEVQLDRPALGGQDRRGEQPPWQGGRLGGREVADDERQQGEAGGAEERVVQPDRLDLAAHQCTYRRPRAEL